MEGYKPGDLICHSDPFAFALNDSKRGMNCDYCFRSTEEPVFDKSSILTDASIRPKPKRCSQCQVLYFCNQECQRNAWQSFHKDECNRLKKCPLQTASLLIARLYIKLKNGGKYGRSKITDEIGGHQRSFDDLEQHDFNIRKDSDRMSMLLVARSMLKNFCPDIFDESNEDDVKLIEEVYGKFAINSFEIVNWQFQSIGAGLYLGPSILDHSCDPDAYVTFNGTSCTVRAAKNIPHNDVKKIFISYVDVGLSKEIRQKQLQEQYYFSCQCNFCVEDKFESSKFEVLDLDKASISNVLSFSQDLLEERLNKKINSESVDVVSKLSKCREILDLQEGVLGKFHLYRMNLLDIGFGYCLDLEMWDEALELGLQLFELNRLYYGETHCDHGDLLFKIAKLYLNKNDLDQGIKWLEKAKKVFEKILDEDHTLWVSLNQQLERAQLEKMYYSRSDRPLVPGSRLY